MGNRATSWELIELGKRIREKRQEARLSQEMLAEQAGISPNTISRIEGGQTAMSVEIFHKLVQILDGDANQLLGSNVQAMEERIGLWELFQRARNLNQREQEIVVQTMTALLKGFENNNLFTLNNGGNLVN